MKTKWKNSGVTEVETTRDVFDESNEVLATMLKTLAGDGDARVFLVADGHVVQSTKSLGQKIGRYFQTYGITLIAPPVVMVAGEKIKQDDFFAFRKILSAAVEARAGVGDVLVALGGGSLFDVAGSVAAQVGGGMKYVKLPTTVPAMVDGAFAQRTLLNCGTRKDRFGVFYPADGIVIDPFFAATVMDGVWRAGFAEMLRIALATDAKTAEKLISIAPNVKKREMEGLDELVASVVKQRVRAGSVNLGLWCAERLGSMSSYKLPHGYAVAVATAIMMRYSTLRGLIPVQDAERVINALGEMGALDSLGHSQHLIAMPKRIAAGFDIWRITNPGGIEVLSALGERVIEDSMDEELMMRAVSSFAVDNKEQAVNHGE